MKQRVVVALEHVFVAFYSYSELNLLICLFVYLFAEWKHWNIKMNFHQPLSLMLNESAIKSALYDLFHNGSTACI